MLTEIFNARWDQTEELLKERDANRWKRRLDSIARLIENASTCAAIAVVEGDSFLIATNKDFVENSRDQGYLLIDSVMSFFKRVAEGQEPTPGDFKAVFSEICKGAMSGLQLSAYLRDQLVENDFIDRVIASGNTTDFRELRDYIAEQVEIGHYPNNQAAAFVVCLALLTDFRKVIQFIKNNRDVSNNSPTAEFINAFRNYNESNIITRRTLAGKVATSEAMHAEMRILALIEHRLRDNKKQYENYIGISKLCCLDCHAMIYAVNNSDYNNKIEIRGAHNVQHSLHWMPPFNIIGIPPRLIAQSRGKTRGSASPDLFKQAVVSIFGTAYRMAYSNVTVGASGVSEYANDSHSSSGDAEESIVMDFLSRLNTKKQELEQLRTIPGITIEPIVLSTIELLLTHLNNPKTTLGFSLKNYVVHLEVKDIAGYLFELNDQKDLLEGLNDNVKTVIEILRNQVLVGTRISTACSNLTFSRPQQDDHQLQVAQAYSSSPMPPTNITSESGSAGSRTQNTPIRADVPHMPSGLFLSPRGKSVADFEVASEEERRTFPVPTDMFTAAKDDIESPTSYLPEDIELPESTEEVKQAPLKKQRFE